MCVAPVYLRGVQRRSKHCVYLPGVCACCAVEYEWGCLVAKPVMGYNPPPPRSSSFGCMCYPSVPVCTSCCVLQNAIPVWAALLTTITCIEKFRYSKVGTSWLTQFVMVCSLSWIELTLCSFPVVYICQVAGDPVCSRCSAEWAGGVPVGITSLITHLLQQGP